MAKRRMFSLDIIDTDVFLEMPQSSRLLYYELCMRADDDGFVSNPRKIQKMVGCNEDDFKVLITKKFIIPFDTGIVVIVHWKIHNYIKKDRYKETIYEKEKSQLYQGKNGMYTKCIPNGSKMDTQVRLELGKGSIDKSNSRSSPDNNINFNNSIIENDSCVDGFQDESDGCDDGFQTIIDFYNNNIGMLTPFEFETLKDYSSDMDNDVILYALQLAVLADVRSMRYIKAILNNWSKKGIKTLIEAKKENESRKCREGSDIQIETEEEKKMRKIRELEESMNGNKGIC